MTRSIVEPWRLCVQGLLKNDAHRWPRSNDCRILRLTSQAKYGNNRVQEIVSGTMATFLAGCQILPCNRLYRSIQKFTRSCQIYGSIVLPNGI